MREANQNYRWKQASFAGGLFGKQLYGRDDLQQYLTGAKVMRNFYPYPYGGFTRRTGTFFVNETKDSSKKSRLIPFVYSDKTAFMLEFGDHYFRVYRDGGRVGNVEVWTPYGQNELDAIKYVQSADRMYLVHPNYQPRIIARYSDTDWRLETFQFQKGPFESQNSTNTTIRASGQTGTVTLTASSNIFTPDMVGGLIKLSHNIYGQAFQKSGHPGNIDDWYSPSLKCNGNWKFVVQQPTNATITVDISNDNGGRWQVLRSYSIDHSAAAMSDSGKVDHPCLLRLHFNGGGDDDWYYNLYFSCDPFIGSGFATITGYTNANTVTAQVFQDNNDYIFGFWSTDATPYWSLGSFSNHYGWPSVIAFYQDRLFFGGSRHNPLGVYGSVSGDYNNFYVNETPKDDDAVSFMLNAGRVNTPQNLVSMRVLLGFTTSSEWQISGGGSNGAITPSNVSASQQSANGSSPLMPIVVDDRLLYQTKQGMVRDIAYDYSYDTYRGDDLTLFNRDLFEGHKLVSWCRQTSPDNVIWAARDDGKLLSLTYIYDQKVHSWAIHETDGYVESIESIPGDTQDEVYMIVRRTINGQEKRYVELLAHKSLDMNHMNYLDCALRADFKNDITRVSGLSHLEGKTVEVLADGSYLGKFTVSKGAIELDKPVKHVTVGLPYESDFETMDIPVPSQRGTSYGVKKKVSTIHLKMLDTFGGLVGINGFNRMMPIKMQAPVLIGGVPPLYSGDYRIEPGADYQEQATITVKQDRPYPLTCLTMSAEVAMG